MAAIFILNIIIITEPRVEICCRFLTQIVVYSFNKYIFIVYDFEDLAIAFAKYSIYMVKKHITKYYLFPLIGGSLS